MTEQQRAVLAGGCFWGMQDLIRARPGVLSTRVGYTGGDTPNATGGGAPLMIRDGVLDAAGTRVEAAFAIHVGPRVSGVFQTKAGPIMARARSQSIRAVYGRIDRARRCNRAIMPTDLCW